MRGYDSWKARELDYDYAEPVGECDECGYFTVLYPEKVHWPPTEKSWPHFRPPAGTAAPSVAPARS